VIKILVLSYRHHAPFPNFNGLFQIVIKIILWKSLGIYLTDSNKEKSGMRKIRFVDPGSTNSGWYGRWPQQKVNLLGQDFLELENGLV